MILKKSNSKLNDIGCIPISELLVPEGTESNKLIVNKNYGEGLVSVELNQEKFSAKHQPLDDDDTLTEYHKYTKKGRFPCHRFKN